MSQPRDNVLLEYGLFTGMLGGERVIICREGKPKNPSDLHGVITLDFSAETLNTVRTHLTSWIELLAWEVIKRILTDARKSKNFPNGYRTIKRVAEKIPLAEDKVLRILKQHSAELVFDKISDGDGVRLKTK